MIAVHEPIKISFFEIVKRFVVYDTMSWFLISLFLTRVIFAIVLRLNSEKIIILFSICLLAITFFLQNESISWYLQFFCAFSFGYLYKEYEPKTQSKKVMAVSILSFILICAVVLSGLLNMNIALKNIASISFFVSAMALLSRFEIKLKVKRFVEFCGEYSMILYCVHFVTDLAMLVILSKLFRSLGIILLLFYLLTFGIFACMVLLSEKIKFFEYLFYPYNFFKNYDRVKIKK